MTCRYRAVRGLARVRDKALQLGARCARLPARASSGRRQNDDTERRPPASDDRAQIGIYPLGPGVKASARWSMRHRRHHPSLCRAGRRRQRRCACFCKRTVRHFQDVLETVDPLVSGVSY